MESGGGGRGQLWARLGSRHFWDHVALSPRLLHDRGWGRIRQRVRGCLAFCFLRRSIGRVRLGQRGNLYPKAVLLKLLCAYESPCKNVDSESAGGAPQYCVTHTCSSDASAAGHGPHVEEQGLRVSRCFYMILKSLGRLENRGF